MNRKTVNMNARTFGAAAALCIGATAQASGFGLADFDWQIVDTAMGSAEVTDEAIHITGGDAGIPGITEATTVASTELVISFDWDYFAIDEGSRFDFSYYVINGVQTQISDNSGFPMGFTGSGEFVAASGDVFGFGVETVDGVAGPGLLDITNFKAVPSPSVISVLALAGVITLKRRR